MADIIDLQNVTKSYEEEEALRGVTFKVGAGTIGLLGPNGAGKSTLLKVLLGLLPYSGQASVLGLDPRTSAHPLRARIGYMPEGECHLGNLNAVEFCAYAAELSGLPSRVAMTRAQQALGYVGLGDKRHLKVDGYSTGMKQKAKLAQAIVHDPDLLLLDEPTSGLDPRGRDEMLDLIRQIPGRRGGALVLSSHILHDIEKVCDQVVVLSEGRVRFAGTLRALRAGETGCYVVRIKGEEAPFLRALESRGIEKLPSSNGELRLKLPAGARTDLLLRAAIESGVQVRSLELEQKSLEAAFLATVGGGS